MKLLNISLAALLCATSAQAYDSRTIEIRGSHFWVNEGQTYSLNIGGWKRLKKIYVQAQARGCAAQVEVSANGDAKGTIYLPARDPSYIVTIEETVATIEFRNFSGCQAEIMAVTAVGFEETVSHRDYHHSDGILSDAALNRAAELCGRTIELVNHLENTSDAFGYTTFLLPIKKSAARAYALANAHGPYSHRVIQGLRALQAQIDAAESFLDNSFERQDAFFDAVALLSIREKIDAILE